MTLLKQAFVVALFALTTTSVFAHSGERYQEQVVKTFSAGASTQLQIENTNGKVEIEAWNKDEVLVTASISTKDAADREKVKVELSQNGDTINIDTHFSRQLSWSNNNYSKVDYFINVPAYIELADVELNNGSLSIKGVTGEIKASLNNGSLVATGLAGNTHIDSNNGSVKLSYADNLAALSHVDVDSQNGSITIYFPESVDARIKAKSNNGSISNNFGLQVDKSRSNRKTLLGEIGSGKAKVNLYSNNGSIRIKSL